MPASADGTRERLLDEAERLFAEHGILGTTTRQITEAAQQRNASAVTYHFESREGLLRAVLARRGAPIDGERGRRRAAIADRDDVRGLVECLVVPWVGSLTSRSGRDYVRIVDQLHGRFAAWRTESSVATTAHLTEILDELEAVSDGSAPRARERVVAMIVLLTGMTADRARRLEDGAATELSHDEFIALLVDLCSTVVAGPDRDEPGGQR